MVKCNKCQDTGLYIDELGLEITCECELRRQLGHVEKEVVTAPIYMVNRASAEITVKKRLIPESRIADDFNAEKVEENIRAMRSNADFRVVKFKEYIELLNGILSTIAINGKIKNSYLIGAPNGFGKTSFVNSCIKIMDMRGQKAVPFISLSELAEVRAENEAKLLGTFRAYDTVDADGIEIIREKEPERCVDKFSWSEYMNADILFTYLTSVESKELESKVLKAIMDIRGTKGLPTIVFISTALTPYLKDEKLFEYVWSEIYSYNDERAGYDRLVHKSTYKKYIKYIQAKQGSDY